MDEIHPIDRLSVVEHIKELTREVRAGNKINAELLKEYKTINNTKSSRELLRDKLKTSLIKHGFSDVQSIGK